MRIAYVITRGDSVGGASIHVRDLSRAMLDRGHDVLVLVGGEGPVAGQLAGQGVPFRSLRFLQRSIHPWRDFRAARELAASLRQFRPDIVSTHTAKAGWIGRAVCAQLGIPAVYTPHGWTIGTRISAASGAVFAAAERMAARWSAAIICVCEYERRLAIEKKVGVPEQFFVVPNGVRDIFASQRADARRTPARIAAVARYEAPKDHDTLLRALAQVQGKWSLDLIGDGPLEGEIRRLAETLGLARRVRFLGYRADVAAALADAQLFALSSRSEALPRSVLEAMRAGLPVVASDVGGVREAVEDGASGILVPAGDTAPLASALETLLADSNLRQRMGAAGRLVFERRFGVERMIGDTEAVYVNVRNRLASAERHG